MLDRSDFINRSIEYMLILDSKSSYNNEINEIISKIFTNFESINEYSFLSDLPERIVLDSNEISFIVHFNRTFFQVNLFH